MGKVDVQELIRVGAHFGHRTSRWNPKMDPYIFKRRNLIHIIDVRETVRGLIAGSKLCRVLSQRGSHILFVGTKRQTKSIVKSEATCCNMPYVCERWPGGLLTNYVTIRSRLERLLELEQFDQTGQMQLYGKKLVSSLNRERRKIDRNLGGVRNMERLPGLLVVVDPARERIAVGEAAKLNVPTIALIDTDGDPDKVDVVVPGNDDSIGCIEVFLRTMADAVLAGLELGEPIQAPAAQEGREYVGVQTAAASAAAAETDEGQSAAGAAQQETPVESPPVEEDG